MYEDEKTNKTRKNLLKLLIIACLIAIACLLWFLDSGIILVLGLAALILAIAIFRIIIQMINRPKTITYPPSQISRFVLMDQDGGYEKEWHISGGNSFLIGKNTAENEVDIDLGDTRYSEFVSPEHAFINHVHGSWHIEDNDSESGVGLKRKGEDYIYSLKSGVPYSFNAGDVIYISKAKLLVL